MVRPAAVDAVGVVGRMGRLGEGAIEVDERIDAGGDARAHPTDEDRMIPSVETGVALALDRPEGSPQGWDPEERLFDRDPGEAIGVRGRKPNRDLVLLGGKQVDDVSRSLVQDLVPPPPLADADQHQRRVERQ